jgi:hypothetical protein
VADQIKPLVLPLLNEAMSASATAGGGFVRLFSAAAKKIA